MFRAVPPGDAGCPRKGIGFLLLLMLGLLTEWRHSAFGEPTAAQRIDERAFFDLYDAGVAHAEAGDAAEALKAWLEAFDRSRGVPGLEEARLTLPLDGILALAEGYEPAHAALVERRNAAERALVEGRTTIEDAEQMVALNALLSGPERSLAAYDRYLARRDGDPEIAAVLRDLLWAELVAAGRYGELASEAEARAEELMPLLRLAQEAMERDAEAAWDEVEGPGELEDWGEETAAMPAGDESSGEIWFHGDEELDLVEEALELYEVLLGAGRSAGARELREAILELEPEAGEVVAEIHAGREAGSERRAEENGSLRGMAGEGD